MITTLIALTLSQSLVSFETKAERIPVVLSGLEARSGLKLDCDGVFENEVVVLRVKDVSPGILLEKLATACTAVWEKKGEKLILRPDSVARRRQEVERMDRRVARVEILLDQCRKELEVPYVGAKPPERTRGVDSNRTFYAANRNTPFRRFAMRLLLALGPRRLAAIERGQRVVYAQNPNALQVKWPSECERALQELRKEWTTLANSSHGAEADGGAPRLGQSHRNGPGVTLTPDSVFKHVWISIPDLINNGSDQMIINAGVQNENLFGFGDYLDLYSPPSDFVPKPSTIPLTEFEPDAATEHFMNALDQTGMIRGQRTIGQSHVLAKLLTFPTFEPLSIGSEFLIKLAELREVNLVALVSDGAQAYFTRIQSPITARAIDSQMRYVFRVEESDGWIVASPKEPVDARLLRENRKVLRQMILASQTGKLPLERECEYLAKRPAAYPVGLGLRYVALFDSNIPTGYSPGELAAKRLLGLMGEFRAGLVQVGRLPKPAQAELARSLFFDRVSLQQTPPSKLEISEKLDYSRTLNAEEPTLLFPNGIPPEAVLDISEESISEVREFRGNDMWAVRDLEPNFVAHERFNRDNPSLTNTSSPTLKGIDGFQAIDTRLIKMRLLLGDYYKLDWVKDRTPRGQRGSYESLPESLRKQIQLEYDKIKSQRANGQIHPAPNRQSNPPPPSK